MAVSVKLKFKRTRMSSDDLNLLLSQGFTELWSTENEVEIEVIYLTDMLVTALDEVSSVLDDNGVFPHSMKATEFNFANYLDKSLGMYYNKR